jgi:hypothetical protein
MNEQELEKQLKSALGREEAPEWFEARVMNAANAVKHKAATRMPWFSPFLSMTWPSWKWVAGMAVAGLVGVGVGAEWQHSVQEERLKEARFEAQQREAGEAAKAQLKLAFRITSAKLVEIQKRIDDARQDN